MKQTSTTLTKELSRSLLMNGATYSLLFAAWLVLELLK